MLDEKGVDLYAYGCRDAVFPRADTWLKVAKAMSKSPRQCVAVVSSKAACKSALSSGIRCIVVPDSFTTFQDFGGADGVYDSFEDIPVDEVLDAMFPEVVPA